MCSDFDHICPGGLLFSSLEPNAHRMSLYYTHAPSPVRHRPSFTISKIFSKTAWPIKLKLYVEPPWVGEMKVCSRDLSHMTKMAATPIYGKNP